MKSNVNFRFDMNKIEINEILNHQFFHPSTSNIDSKIEHIERNSDIEFVFQRILPNTTVSSYIFDTNKGQRVSNFAVDVAGMVDLFSPVSRAVFRDTMNAELDRLDLGMQFVEGKSVRKCDSRKERTKVFSHNKLLLRHKLLGWRYVISLSADQNQARWVKPSINDYLPNIQPNKENLELAVSINIFNVMYESLKQSVINFKKNKTGTMTLIIHCGSIWLSDSGQTTKE